MTMQLCSFGQPAERDGLTLCVSFITRRGLHKAQKKTGLHKRVQQSQHKKTSWSNCSMRSFYAM